MPTDVHGSVVADGTEQTLADTSAAGTYQLKVDLNPVVAGDVVRLRIYDMVLTSGTRRVAYDEQFTLTDLATSKIVVSVPIMTALTDSGAIRATLQQTKGSNHTYPWALVKA